MKKDFEFIDHTADVEFIAHGKSLEETFKNAFLALFDTMTYSKKLASGKAKSHKVVIKEKAKDPEMLLWYGLQDAVSTMDSANLLAYKVSKISVKEKNKLCTLEVELLAKPKTEANAKFDVKGISRYDLKISKRGKSFTASVVMDV